MGGLTEAPGTRGGRAASTRTVSGGVGGLTSRHVPNIGRGALGESARLGLSAPALDLLRQRGPPRKRGPSPHLRARHVVEQGPRPV